MTLQNNNLVKKTLIKILAFSLSAKFLLTISSIALADVRLPRLLSDHAILQRDSEIRLWGWANPGESVHANLDGKPLGSTSAMENGKWEVHFEGLPAGGPHTLAIHGDNTITLNNIYFGDLWVASGQSNMQLPMARVEEKFSAEIAQANYPQIRQFTVPRTMNFDAAAEDFEGGEWEMTTPQSVMAHSATAYFFAKKIHREEQVPIGILSANFGGSPAECWLAEDALKNYPEAYRAAKSYQDAEYLQSLKDSDQKNIDAWSAHLDNSDAGLQEALPWYAENYQHQNWKTLQVPSLWADEGIAPMSGTVWFRKTVTLNENASTQSGMLRLGSIVDADTAYINGQEVGKTTYQYPPRRYKLKPGALKAGKNTIALRIQVNNKAGEFIADMPYFLQAGDQRVDLAGAWHYKTGTVVNPPKARQFIPWNQPLGCYNAMLAPLLNMKIKGVIWYQGESNTGRPKEYAELFPHLIQHWREVWQQGDFPFLFAQLPNFDTSNANSGWPELRFAQFQTLKKSANTAMAITIDVGESNDLHPLDKKSVGERLALGAQALAYKKKNLVYSGPLFRATTKKGKSLVIEFDFVGDGLHKKGRKLGGFELADADGKFEKVRAKIKNNTVQIKHRKMHNFTAVRYAWSDDPESANLYNKNGLPASPFQASIVP